MKNKTPSRPGPCSGGRSLQSASGRRSRAARRSTIRGFFIKIIGQSVLPSGQQKIYRKTKLRNVLVRVVQTVTPIGTP